MNWRRPHGDPDPPLTDPYPNLHLPLPLPLTLPLTLTLLGGRSVALGGQGATGRGAGSGLWHATRHGPYGARPSVLGGVVRTYLSKSTCTEHSLTTR